MLTVFQQRQRRLRGVRACLARSSAHAQRQRKEFFHRPVSLFAPALAAEGAGSESSSLSHPPRHSRCHTIFLCTAVYACFMLAALLPSEACYP